MDCLFCKITKKEISAEIVYEDAAAIAILDINSKAPGHTMVLPKVHAENILDLPENQIGPTFLTVQRVTAILQKALQPKGFTIGINHGRVSGQTIDHLHIHILPRFEGDQGGSIHSVVDNPPKDSLKEMANKIRRAAK